LSEKLDFILVGPFKGWENFFLNRNTNCIAQEMTIWRRYIEERLSRLAVAFRSAMSAKGTTLFAWFSSKPMAGCGVVCSIKVYLKSMQRFFHYGSIAQSMLCKCI